MAFYSYLSTKIIIAFITKSYQDLFGVRSYINAIIFVHLNLLGYLYYDETYNSYTISFSVFVVPRTIVQILHNRQGTFQQSDQQNISGPERHDMDCHRRRTEPL